MAARRWLTLVCLFLLPAVAVAQAPVAEEVLRLVPDDAGLCLVVNDLRGNTQKLLEARWVKTLLDSPLGKAIAGTPELNKLDKFNQELKTHLQVDWPQFRDEILGQCVVFAYRPEADSDPKKEQGLLLVRTPNAKLLGELVDRFQKAQKQSGELRELSSVQYKGVVYFRRVDAKGTNYYWLNDGLLAFSPQQELIQAAIERSKSASSSRFAQQIQRAGLSDAFVVLCVNARAFDSELARKLEQADAKDRQVLTTFRRYWNALDGVVLSYRQKDGNELTATFQGRTNDLPAGGRQLFEQLATPSELWNRFPDNAMLRMAGRLDVAAFTQALGEFATPRDRQAAIDGLQKLFGALGLDVNNDLLPNLGPDVGFCLVPAPDKNHVPYLIAAVAVRPGDKQLDRSIFQAVSSAALWAMVSHNLRNRDRIVMKTRVQDGVEIKYLANSKTFPRGFEPALAIKDGYLLLTTHPDAVSMFRKGAVAVAGEVPVLQVSFTRLGDNLQQRRAELTKYLLLQKRNLPQEAIAGVLDSLSGTLEVFDEVTLTPRAQAGQISWTLRLKQR